MPTGSGSFGRSRIIQIGASFEWFHYEVLAVLSAARLVPKAPLCLLRWFRESTSRNYQLPIDSFVHCQTTGHGERPAVEQALNDPLARLCHTAVNFTVTLLCCGTSGFSTRVTLHGWATGRSCTLSILSSGSLPAPSGPSLTVLSYVTPFSSPGIRLLLCERPALLGLATRNSGGLHIIVAMNLLRKFLRVGSTPPSSSMRTTERRADACE